ncbi:MAG: exodeoxyribonuclease V subunit alpha [Desulfobulbaceae bacterium]|jgi:exodeoxyribonuclease V alpha subunit|nr:exodeoxyribonuclease V subunit alpha [Desulfobulbaceae bacterium]
MMRNRDQNQLDLSFGRFLADLGGSSDLLFRAGQAVSKARREGNVCVALDQIAVGMDLQDLQNALLATGLVGEAGDYCPLILHQEYLYLQRYFRYETLVADRIRADALVMTTLADSEVPVLLDQLFPQPDDGELDQQKLAALSALCHSFSVISGGPGTGKTTTVAKILALHLALDGDCQIMLGAPTGKAATRLQESLTQTIDSLDVDPHIKEKITLPVMTIHRLLGFGRSGFRYDREHPLKADVVLIDEASMVDLPLMAALIQALPQTCKLILLGDQYQLASVQPGAVLGEICSGGDGFTDDFRAIGQNAGVAVPDVKNNNSLANSIVTLHRSYRFHRDSGIRLLSDFVKEGDGHSALDVLCDPSYPDVVLQQPQIVNLVADISAAYHSEQTDLLAGFSRLGVLCCHRSGVLGVEAVNQQVAAHIHQAGQPYYHGLPLMVIANDHALGLYNGDTCVVVERQGRFYGCFQVGGALRYVLVRQLPPHTQAYAITVHKSQGSEYDKVAFLLPQGGSLVLGRELVYTALTRARHMVTVYGEPGQFVEAVAKKVVRVSGLAGRIW